MTTENERAHRASPLPDDGLRAALTDVLSALTYTYSHVSTDGGRPHWCHFRGPLAANGHERTCAAMLAAQDTARVALSATPSANEAGLRAALERVQAAVTDAEHWRGIGMDEPQAVREAYFLGGNEVLTRVRAALSGVPSEGQSTANDDKVSRPSEGLDVASVQKALWAAGFTFVPGMAEKFAREYAALLRDTEEGRLTTSAALVAESPEEK